MEKRSKKADNQKYSAVAVAEDEDTFPESSAEDTSTARPSNSLLGRRNTGNNLYIKIPSNGGAAAAEWVKWPVLFAYQIDEMFFLVGGRVSRSGDSSSSSASSSPAEDGDAENNPLNSNYRRNSISMPVLNTMDLDALRQLHEKAVQDKMVSQLSKIIHLPASISIEWSLIVANNSLHGFCCCCDINR